MNITDVRVRKVTKEGNSRKFVNEIEQISFNGEASLKQGKKHYGGITSFIYKG